MTWRPMNLASTPGPYYAVAFWLATSLYIELNRKRGGGLRQILVRLVFLPAIVAFGFATDYVPIWLWAPSLLTEYALCLAMLMICTDMPPQNGFYFLVRAIMLAEFCASFEWQIYYFMSNHYKVHSSFWIAAVFAAVCYGAVMVIMYLSERRYKADNQKMLITRRELATVLTLFCLTLVVSNMSYLTVTSPFSTVLAADLFTIRTIADMGGVGVLYVYHLRIHEMSRRLELEKIHATTMMQYNTYQQTEDSIAMVNQKYHDLKHQIALLRLETNSEQMQQYLDQMALEIQQYEAQNKTGNKVLDTILTSKSLTCQRLGITMTCIANGAQLEFMDLLDMNALFGNALDNAIEGTQNVQIPEERMIQVSVARRKQFVVVKIRNRCALDLFIQNQVPETTKQDKRFHGFGVKSMVSTVHKYGGSISINARDGWFDLNILFPV